MANSKNTGSAVALGIGALLVGVCFILPWVVVKFLEEVVLSVSGMEIARLETYLWLIPLGAVLGLAWAIYASYYQGDSTHTLALAGLGTACLPLLAFFALLLRVQTSLGMVGMVVDITVDIFGYGFWGTVVGILLMLTGGVLALTSTQQASGISSTEWMGPTYGRPSTTQAPPLPPSPTVPAPPPRPTYAPAPPPPPTEVVGLAAQAEGWLVGRSGSQSGQSFGLKRGNNTVGRDPRQADVVVDDSTVSGGHARIKFEGGQFYLYDLASTNGSFINNRRVQRQLLMDGDIVRFGNVELVFKKA